MIDITGGWPDAGDYGRYMPSAATSMGTMLLFDNVPPQHATTDELQVLRRELDWMLKMQRADGAVYHKVTPLNFGGFDSGSDNIGGQPYLFDASTPDAAVFAAVMAEAPRVYRPLDPVYADRMLAAAEKLWAWLQDNPSQSFRPRQRAPARTSTVATAATASGPAVWQRSPGCGGGTIASHADWLPTRSADR